MLKIRLKADEPITRNMVSSILEMNKFNLASTENSKARLQQMPIFKPDFDLVQG